MYKLTWGFGIKEVDKGEIHVKKPHDDQLPAEVKSRSDMNFSCNTHIQPIIVN